MRSFILTFSVFLSFGLGACASVLEGQSTEVTVLTPGAENARCLLDNGTVVVSAMTGDTVRVEKNYKDLHVTCAASGNRTVEKTIPIEIQEDTYWNVLNGIIPGTSYDIASKAVYDYPDKITINFTGLRATEYPLPEYHAYDAVKSEDVVLEEFLPGTPTLSTDRGRTQPVLRKVDPSERAGNNPFISNTELSGGSNAPVSLTPN